VDESVLYFVSADTVYPVIADPPVFIGATQLKFTDPDAGDVIAKPVGGSGLPTGTAVVVAAGPVLPATAATDTL
jgi:hypothetical protein